MANSLPMEITESEIKIGIGVDGVNAFACKVESTDEAAKSVTVSIKRSDGENGTFVYTMIDDTYLTMNVLKMKSSDAKVLNYPVWEPVP
jgi:hypothetical protein